MHAESVRLSRVEHAAMAPIRGEEAADQAVAEIRGGCAAPDLLLRTLKAEASHADPVRLRGFCRRLQKALEGSR